MSRPLCLSFARVFPLLELTGEFNVELAPWWGFLGTTTAIRQGTTQKGLRS